MGARAVEPHVGTIIDWISGYLCRPHPNLGRTGPVCPYVPRAWQQGTLYLADVALTRRAAIEERLGRYLAWLKRMLAAHPSTASHTAVLLTLSRIDQAIARALVDDLQQNLKPSFAAQGLMIGEFHDGPPAKPGLHNPRFRPLFSPVPMLAIRPMVATDLVFLSADRTCLEAYLKLIGTAVPRSLLPQLDAGLQRFGLALPWPVGEPG